MAWYDWWRPLRVGHFDAGPAYLNLLLPFMNPFEQAGAAQRIMGIDSPDIQEALEGTSYARPTGAPAAEQAWLGGLGGLSSALSRPPTTGWGEEYASLEGDANLAWFKSLGDVASQLSRARTRAERQTAEAAAEGWLTQAPEDISGFGANLLNPYLAAPSFGSIKPPSYRNYARPYQVRGGLVANPWYV